MVLEQRAQTGDTQAQLALAAQFERLGNIEMARGWMARAMQAGHPDGLRLLAASLMAKTTDNILLDGLGAGVLLAILGSAFWATVSLHPARDTASSASAAPDKSLE